jgi:hypothetical protein
MTGRGWMTGGCWGAHPTTSNVPAMITDRNFTLLSLAPLTPCARRCCSVAAFTEFDS